MELLIVKALTQTKWLTWTSRDVRDFGCLPFLDLIALGLAEATGKASGSGLKEDRKTLQKGFKGWTNA